MGFQIRENIFISNLPFADDQVIVAQDHEDADYMCRKLQEEYRKWGLKINPNKTEYMTVFNDETEIERHILLEKFKTHWRFITK